MRIEKHFSLNEHGDVVVAVILRDDKTGRVIDADSDTFDRTDFIDPDVASAFVRAMPAALAARLLKRNPLPSEQRDENERERRRND